jgi:hypothetical protein
MMNPAAAVAAAAAARHAVSWSFTFSTFLLYRWGTETVDCKHIINPHLSYTTFCLKLHLPKRVASATSAD